MIYNVINEHFRYYRKYSMQRLTQYLTFPGNEKITSIKWWHLLIDDIMARNDKEQIIADAKLNPPTTVLGFILREAIRGSYTDEAGVSSARTFPEAKYPEFKSTKVTTGGLTIPNEGDISGIINTNFRQRFGSLSTPRIFSVGEVVDEKQDTKPIDEKQHANSVKDVELFLKHLRRYPGIEKQLGFSRFSITKRMAAKKLGLNITTKCPEIWLIGIPLLEINLSIDTILKATTNEAKRTECFTSLASLTTPPETRTEFKKVLQNLDLYEGESKEGEFVRAALNDIKQKEDQKVEPAPTNEESLKARLIQEFEKFKNVTKHIIEAAKLSLDAKTRDEDVRIATETYDYLKDMQLFPADEAATYANIEKAAKKFKEITTAYYNRQVDVIKNHAKLPSVEKYHKEHKNVALRYQTALSQERTFTNLLKQLFNIFAPKSREYKNTKPSEAIQKELIDAELKLQFIRNLEKAVTDAISEIRKTQVNPWTENSTESKRLEATEDEYKIIKDLVEKNVKERFNYYRNHASLFAPVDECKTPDDKMNVFIRKALEILDDRVRKIPNPAPPPKGKEKVIQYAKDKLGSVGATLYSTGSKIRKLFSWTTTTEDKKIAPSDTKRTGLERKH